MKPIIGFDGDDLLWDTTQALSRHFKKKYGEQTLPRTTWDWQCMFPYMCAERIVDIYNRDIHEIMNPHLLKSCKGVDDLLSILKWQGYPLIIVTKNIFPGVVKDISRILFPGLFDEIEILEDKRLSSANILIEDSFANVKEFLHFDGNKHGILVDKGWNRDYTWDFTGNIYVVDKYKEIYAIIEGIKNGKGGEISKDRKI